MQCGHQLSLRAGYIIYINAVLADSKENFKMTTLREDVLLQIPEVRYKKGDGTM